MVAHIVTRGLCGFYLRVLEEGEAQAGDMLERTRTGNTQWSVARVFALVFGAGSKPSRGEIAALLELDGLSQQMRSGILRRFGN